MLVENSDEMKAESWVDMMDGEKVGRLAYLKAVEKVDKLVYLMGIHWVELLDEWLVDCLVCSMAAWKVDLKVVHSVC